MSADTNPVDGDTALGGRITGWADWASKVREVLALAADQRASLLMLDTDFTQWPLGEIACVESLEQWSLRHSQVHCTLLARDWTAFPRQHPRWLRWRGTWAHKVSCKAVAEEDISSLQPLRPTLVLQGVMGLQLLDTDAGVGLWSQRPAQLHEWWQFGDAISQRSAESMPVTTVGL